MTLTTEQVYASLTTGNPTSLVRYGDGESIVLNSTTNLAAYRLANTAVFKRQMGYLPTIEQVDAIRNNLIDAYEDADIIGIPMHKQKTNEHWQSANTVLLDTVKSRRFDTCSIDVHYDFLNEGYYDLLIGRYERLSYIGCRELDYGFQRRYKHLDRVSKFVIAPEAKFTSGYDGDVHYPTQFNRVQRWMDFVDAEGQLLLVGAGVIGKIYCNWWRDRGGVAMDVGSCMDEWAGFVTRGADRGLDKVNEDTKYKL